MGCDYDLVIVGATTAGVAAAQEALSLGARVALVSQGEWLSDTQLLLETQALQHRLSGDRPTRETLGQELQALLTRQQHMPSPSDLLRQGVDVVEGMGQLIRPRDLAIGLSHRRLKGRRLLLTPPIQYRLPNIPGLSLAVPLSRPTELLNQSGDRLVVIGQTALSVAWAQIAQRLGYRTSLLLATAERSVSLERTLENRLLAELMAEGIDAQCADLLQIQRDQGELWMCSQDQYWSADRLLVEPRISPDLTTLRPELLRLPATTLPTNAYLQTRHRRVFACAPELPPTASAVAGRLAVRNALLWRKQRFQADLFPQALPTNPPVAWVGLSLTQARHRWGDRLKVVQTAFQDNLQAQLEQKTGGSCQLICTPQGRLVGAQVIGPRASELIAPLALLVQQRLPLSALAATAVWPSRAIALQDAVQQWQMAKPQSDWCRWWREERFIFWRSL